MSVGIFDEGKTYEAYSSMITAILPRSNRYRLGVNPFPNRYVIWFEHNNPAMMMPISAGTKAKEMVNQVVKTCRSSLRYLFLHPGKLLLA